MEQTLFNELLHQANDLGKRADNGFKKEAWTEACRAVKLVNASQLATIE